MVRAVCWRERGCARRTGFDIANGTSSRRLPEHTYRAVLLADFQRPQKALFFASYEGLYHNRSLTYLRMAPAAKERVGDFSETYVVVNGVPKRIEIYDPFCGLRDPQSVERLPAAPGTARTRRARKLRIHSSRTRTI